MQKTADGCRATDLVARYTFTLSGTATALATGGDPQTVSAEGVLVADSPGKFTYIQKVALGANSAGSGAFEIQSDCIVNFEFTPDDAAARSMKLRGILVSGGKEILAIQADPGQSVAARFIAR